MKLERTQNTEPKFLILIPLFSLCLILLAFFLLITQFVAQPGVALTLPESPFLTAASPDTAIVSITTTPAPALFLNDRRMTPEEFRSALAQLSGKARTIIIRADRRAPFDLVQSASGECLRQGFSVVLASSAPPR